MREIRISPLQKSFPKSNFYPNICTVRLLSFEGRHCLLNFEAFLLLYECTDILNFSFKKIKTCMQLQRHLLSCMKSRKNVVHI